MVSRSVIWISRNFNNLFLNVFNYWLLETEQRLRLNERIRILFPPVWLPGLIGFHRKYPALRI